MSELRRRRDLRGMTQAELAEKAGTSQPQIKRLEAGERKLTKEWANRLAPHLGVSPQKLLFPDKADTSVPPGLKRALADLDQDGINEVFRAATAHAEVIKRERGADE